MKSVHYMTLAAARNADREAFDEAVTNAVLSAAEKLGHDVMVKALCGPSRRSSQALVKKAKAA